MLQVASTTTPFDLGAGRDRPGHSALNHMFEPCFDQSGTLLDDLDGQPVAREATVDEHDTAVRHVTQPFATGDEPLDRDVDYGIARVRLGYGTVL